MYVIYIVTRDKENLVTTFSIVGLFKDENKAESMDDFQPKITTAADLEKKIYG